ncbi:MAG: protein translocase subunit SecF [Pseudomonadota bacterium]
MEFFRKVPNIGFMRQRKLLYAFSALSVAISLGAIFFKGLNLGLDFTGGVVVEASFPGAADIERTRAALVSGGIPDAQVTQFGTSRDVLVRLPPHDDANEVGRRVEAVLQTVDPGVEIRRTEIVGAAIGRELLTKGLTAMAITLALILVYIALRFRWKFGVGAVLATMHDPIVVLGLFAITGLTFDLAVLAAVLAVIGYSINDTVVIFDRVRERFQSMRKSTPTEVFDKSVNETLSRTVITSGSTLIVVVSLFLFGGEALKGFSLALIIGILVGTYSTVYVASGVALDLGVNHKDLIPSERRQPVDDLP